MPLLFGAENWEREQIKKMHLEQLVSYELRNDTYDNPMGLQSILLDKGTLG